MKKLIVIFSLPLLFAHCSSEDDGLKNDVVNLEDSGEVKNELVYAIPSPNEQFDLLQMIGGELIPNIVHDLTRLDDYSSESAVAFNFGVYTADAAYLTKYEQGKKVFMDYVTGLDKLGQKLGISQIYGEELMRNIEEAQDDPDLLYDISGDNYLKVYDKMLENQKGGDLAMILAGGWIETMYILLKTSGDYGQDMEIEDVLAEQRYVLDNLYGFMQNYKENESVSSLLVLFNEVQKAFSMMDCEEAEVEVDKGKSGVFILSGGDSCLFTESSYNALREAVLMIRNKYIA